MANAQMIRQYGDPVLKESTHEVTEINSTIAQLAETMIETMQSVNGAGLAANQIGIQQRVFVYDIGDGPQVVINPQIVESSGEWVYNEGCLSVPGLSWDLLRPNAVHLVGRDLSGNEISVEVDTLEGRVFQHEVDHLNGIVVLERLDEDQRREAKKILGARVLGETSPGELRKTSSGGQLEL